MNMQSDTRPTSRRGLPGDLSWNDALRHGTSAVRFALVVALMVLVGAAPAGAQLSIRDLVTIDGAGSYHITGTGLVTGLSGNGDSPKGETLMMIKNVLGNQLNRTIGDINSRNVALVVVSATLPPYQKPGTTIDVQVTAMGDSKSLAGGTLYITPLRSPGATPDAGILIGVAQGRIVVEGDARTGNPTSGVVKNGLIVEQGIVQKILVTKLWTLSFADRDPAAGGAWKKSEVRPSPTVVLNLKKPDLETAAAIAVAINSEAGRMLSGLPKEHLLQNPLAQVFDGGRVYLRVPGAAEFRDAGAPDPGYEQDPTVFLSDILMKLKPVEQEAKARVVLNDANKSFAIVGSVRVREGIVGWSGGQLRIDQAMPLADFMVKMQNNPAVTPQYRLDVIKVLDQNGMIVGEVVSQ